MGTLRSEMSKWLRAQSPARRLEIHKNHERRIWLVDFLMEFGNVNKVHPNRLKLSDLSLAELERLCDLADEELVEVLREMEGLL